MKSIRILFVCHGNICRSTMAEFVMKHLVSEAGLANHFYIDSAATSTEEIGNDVHYGTRSKLEEEGIPCGHHRARQIKRREAGDWDYVICMDDANVRNSRRILGDAAPIYKLLEFAGSYDDVADPWYTGDFDATFDDVMAGCLGLMSHLGL